MIASRWSSRRRRSRYGSRTPIAEHHSQDVRTVAQMVAAYFRVAEMAHLGPADFVCPPEVADGDAISVHSQACPQRAHAAKNQHQYEAGLDGASDRRAVVLQPTAVVYQTARDKPHDAHQEDPAEAEGKFEGHSVRPDSISHGPLLKAGKSAVTRLDPSWRLRRYLTGVLSPVYLLSEGTMSDQP